MTKHDEALFRLRQIPRVEAFQAEAARCPSSQPLATEAFIALVTVAGALQSGLEERFTKFGLSRGRFIVLMLLRHAQENASTPAELSHHASVTTATMTGLLDGLVNQGLIRRIQREDDRRSTRIELTQEGTALLAQFLPGHYEAIALSMDNLTQTEQQTLTRLLVKLLDEPRACLGKPASTPLSTQTLTPPPRPSRR